MKRQNGRDKDRSWQAKAIPGVKLNHVQVPETSPSKLNLMRPRLVPLSRLIASTMLASS